MGGVKQLALYVKSITPKMVLAQYVIRVFQFQVDNVLLEGPVIRIVKYSIIIFVMNVILDFTLIVPLQSANK